MPNLTRHAAPQRNATQLNIQATCICKFVGTSLGVDAVSMLRKMMGSHALFAKSGLGAPAFVCNATCSAEGDNTIMEVGPYKPLALPMPLPL